MTHIIWPHVLRCERVISRFKNDFQRLYGIVDMIVVRGGRGYRWYDHRTQSRGYWFFTIVRSIIGFTRGCGTLECLACFLFLFLLLLSLTLEEKCHVIIVRTSELLAKSRNGLKRFKMSVQLNILINSTDLQNAMFFTDRLVFSISLDFFTLAHTYHVRLWRSINND